ncbi:MAG: MMPL family transporter, partial [Gemmatimonadetes bacterium]|nr:MMPL family transporter [Gemmatimonadota bacterium]
GMNDDFEREYTDSEDNLRRDEVDIARSVLGITRSLELISAAAQGEVGPEAMEEAADAWALGEPWMLSLDREMLLISCLPEARWGELTPAMESLAEVEAIMFEVGERHPGVYASTTGIVRVGQDEMDSVGFYTVLLSLGALILIYFLLARTFRGWVIPVLALTPLLVGIFWTMGLIWILFRTMNIMTAMMALVLLGLGIDFAIHVVARYQEERRRGGALEGVLARTLSSTGMAVIIGGFTTALAFFTLMVGRTVGFDEFGAASGSGVILTLLAIFVTLPSLLVLRERRLIRKGHGDAGSLGDDGIIRFATREGTKAGETRATSGESGLGGEGYDWIGKVAALGWRRPVPFLGVAAILIAGCMYGMLHTAWEWDLLELEAEGLRSVELQREIP